MRRVVPPAVAVRVSFVVRLRPRRTRCFLVRRPRSSSLFLRAAAVSSAAGFDRAIVRPLVRLDCACSRFPWGGSEGGWDRKGREPDPTSRWILTSKGGSPGLSPFRRSQSIPCAVASGGTRTGKGRKRRGIPAIDGVEQVSRTRIHPVPRGRIRVCTRTKGRIVPDPIPLPFPPPIPPVRSMEFSNPTQNTHTDAQGRQGRSFERVGMTLWSLCQAVLLVTNGMAVLHEGRFLSKCEGNEGERKERTRTTKDPIARTETNRAGTRVPKLRRTTAAETDREGRRSMDGRR